MKKILAITGIFVALAPQVVAHYRRNSLIINGTSTAASKFVRGSRDYNTLITNIASTNLRCNVGAGECLTTSVAAGPLLGLPSTCRFYHHGTLNVYLSKAPSTAASYDGSGPWFKIYQMAPATDGGDSITFPIDNISSANFKIPLATPPGEYLLRTEHIALGDASYSGEAQFYTSCAQVAITGASSGNPSPTVYIPGAYTANESGLLIVVPTSSGKLRS